MADILLYVQQSKGQISKSSLCALSAAKELQKAWGITGIQAVCLGAGASGAAQSLGQFGLNGAYFCEDAVLDTFIAGIYADTVTALAAKAGAKVVVAAATSQGKDFLPRVAAAMNAGQASDIIAVNSDGSLLRPMYAGNVIAEVQILSEQRCVSVRPTAFSAAETSVAAANFTCSSVEAAGVGKRITEVVSYETSGGGRPELSDAAVVVSGGRALQSSQNFESIIFPLADALGAAVGASRAAVDSGYAPNDWQVGQTGKVVAPSLYIAVGISGAIQHLAGMKDSKVIVAINKDAEAPIFEVADYGLVADLFTVVPELTAAIKAAKAI